MNGHGQRAFPRHRIKGCDAVSTAQMDPELPRRHHSSSRQSLHEPHQSIVGHRDEDEISVGRHFGKIDDGRRRKERFGTQPRDVGNSRRGNHGVTSALQCCCDH